MAIKSIKIRSLQRKLYLRSKQEPKKRYYSLYDKIYRMDILQEAYAQCRANRGGAGLDGVTFEERDRVNYCVHAPHFEKADTGYFIQLLSSKSLIIINKKSSNLSSLSKDCLFFVAFLIFLFKFSIELVV